jgi:hypothetical protein
MSGTCKDCRHWRDPQERGELGEVWGFCGKADSKDARPVDASTRAYALDGEAYDARLVTAPDFGCSQFEIKP